MDYRTFSGLFIGYLENSKRCSFYSHNHSTRFDEYGDARFIEGGDIDRSEKLRDVCIQKGEIVHAKLLKLLYLKLKLNPTMFKNNKHMIKQSIKEVSMMNLQYLSHKE